MLPIEYANGWLFTIKKVRPELQAKLITSTHGYDTETIDFIFSILHILIPVFFTQTSNSTGGTSC
jgi:hypothetical protein